MYIHGHTHQFVSVCLSVYFSLSLFVARVRALVLTQLLVFYFAVLLGLPSGTRDRSVKEKEHQEKEEKTKRTDLDHRSDDDDDKTKKKKKKRGGGGRERERERKKH